jgi:hypothetical protein
MGVRSDGQVFQCIYTNDIEEGRVRPGCDIPDCCHPPTIRTNYTISHSQ